MSDGRFDVGMVNTSAGNGSGMGSMPFVPPEGFLSVVETMRIVSACCYIGILVLAAIGNTAIIGIVSSTKNMQTKANVLIVNMAISDLIATIYAVPRMIDVAITNSYEWKIPGVIGETLCKLSSFTREVSCAVSIFSLVAIAIDRFYAIVIPLTNKPKILKLKFLIPMIWIASTMSNALYLYAFQIKTLEVEPGKNAILCYNILTNHQERTYDTFRFVLFIASPLVLLVGLYTTIVIRMSAQNIPGVNVEAVVRTRQKQNKNVVKLAVVIVVSFTVCWLPYYIGVLVHAYYWDSKTKPPNIVIYITEKTFSIFTYISFAINPYICLLFSSNFRSSARRRLCRLNPSGRAVSRITTTTNPHSARALSMTNVEISLEDLNSNATFRRGTHPDSETPSVLDLQGYLERNGNKTPSLCKDDEENVHSIADTPGYNMNQRSDNEDRSATPKKDQTSASVNESKHSKGTYVNGGFEDREI